MDTIPHDFDNAIDVTDRALLHLLRLQPRPNHVNLGDATGEALPDLAAVNWQEMIERATSLGVAPLVFDVLQGSAQLTDISPAAMQRLSGQNNANTLFNLLLYQQLHEVLKVFNEHGVDVLLLKGAYFAKMVYRKIGLRTMSDLDLMVRQRDLALAYRLLAELGFELGSEVAANNEISNPRESAYHDWFSHTTKNLKVEIHWSLEEPDRRLEIDVDDLWARATTTQIFGLPVYLLAPEDTLLHQCIHLSYHHVFQYYSLRGICDIKHLIEYYGAALDWQRLCTQTAAWKAQRSVALTLSLAQRLLGAEIPAAVLDALDVAAIDPRIYAWALQRLLGKVDHNEKPWVSNFARWHLAKSWTAKLEATAKLCFPPQRQIAAQFQVPTTSPRIWFAYLERWSKVGKLLLDEARTQRHPDVRDAQVNGLSDNELGRTALVLWLQEQV